MSVCAYMRVGTKRKGRRWGDRRGWKEEGEEETQEEGGRERRVKRKGRRLPAPPNTTQNIERNSPLLTRRPPKQYERILGPLDVVRVALLGAALRAGVAVGGGGFASLVSA